MRTCSKCKVERELSGFDKRLGAKSGLHSHCRSCRKEYRDANKDKAAVFSKAWYEENKERKAATVRAWDAANPEAKANHRNTRRARKAGNGGTLITEEWKTVLASWLGRCASCGTDKDIHMDHIISLKMGGRHEASNTQPLCKSCNCSKGAKSYSFIRRASWQLMVMTCA